jgi:hypothetical protein
MKMYFVFFALKILCKSLDAGGYSGGRNHEDHGLKLARVDGSQDPCLKKSITKKGWLSGSRCRP